MFNPKQLEALMRIRDLAKAIEDEITACALAGVAKHERLVVMAGCTREAMKEITGYPML